MIKRLIIEAQIKKIIQVHITLNLITLIIILTIKGTGGPKEEIRYDDVISEAELDKYFEDNLFEKQDTIEDKIDKINEKIDRCCVNSQCDKSKLNKQEKEKNKNNEDKSVNDYFRKLIEQKKIKVLQVFFYQK